MTFRRLAAPACLAVLLFGLPGCGAMKFSSSEPAGGDSLALGNAAYEKKDYATACRELSKVASAGPEALARAGDACVRDGREKGERAFTTALSAKASYAPAMEGLGLIALADGNVGRARDMLEAAAKAGGNDPRAAVALGDALLLSGQCDKALSAYQSVAGGGAGQAKARLDAARVLCAARGKGAASPAATSSRPAGASGSELSPAASPAPAAGSPKEPAKPKAAPRTIDLNDI